jgi:hypothetical protein
VNPVVERAAGGRRAVAGNAEDLLQRFIVRTRSGAEVHAPGAHARGAQGGSQPLVTLPEDQFLLALRRDVHLRPPGADQQAVVDDADEVVDEDLGLPVAADFVRLVVGQLVAGRHKAVEVLAVRLHVGHQVDQPRSNDGVGAIVSVHPRHRVVARGESRVLEDRVHLRVGWIARAHRRVELEPPHGGGGNQVERTKQIVRARH